jgi:hypothetical protein
MIIANLVNISFAFYEILSHEHKNPPLDADPSQLNIVPIRTIHFLKFHFNISSPYFWASHVDSSLRLLK